MLELQIRRRANHSYVSVGSRVSFWHFPIREDKEYVFIMILMGWKW